MKTTLKSVVFLLLMIFIVPSCSDQKGEENMDDDKTFQTPEEAATKAKSDLIEVLETHKDISLGIDIEKLRTAELGNLVKYVEVDFEKILSNDSVKSLSEIVGSEKNMVAPYTLNNEVVGIAEIGKVPDGWRVAGLGNEALTDDLNATRITLDKNKAATIYEIPNLQVSVYGVKGDTSETYYLNFERFSLKDSVSISTFYPVLRENAIRFNREFGDKLKSEKLVK